MLLRPHPKKEGRYELVIGARRRRAGLLAKIEAMPASVRVMSDQEVLEVQVIENLQREDVHPLEEAEGYAALLKTPGYDVETVAAKIDVEFFDTDVLFRQPISERGQVVKAFIVPRQGIEATEDLAREIQDFVKKTIAPYKYPRQVVFRTGLPRTETGKVQRYKLRNEP